MAPASNPDTPRPTDEIVDVLIIGSGASGAAVAWSLADTRMKILCLEQGDWIKPTDFPTNGRDWEARRFGDFDISPNRRARDTDYPVNDDNSPMKVANFNGVGGGTVVYTAHFPRMHPTRFSRAVAGRRGGRLAHRLLDARALLRRERPHDGRGRPCRRSLLSAAPAHFAPGAARQNRHALRAGDEQARLALVAVRYCHCHQGVRGPRQVHQSRPLHARMCAGCQGERRHHLLAACAAGPGGAAHALPGARDHRQRAGHGLRRRLLRSQRGGDGSSRRRW